jgi:hypothetical protein
MVNTLNTSSAKVTVPVFAQKALDRCHVVFPDCAQPTGAIMYEKSYYVYVRFFASPEKAQNAAQRLIGKGRKVILTRVRKGIVLWVHEPEAQPAR